jgi:hypothetical protein
MNVVKTYENEKLKLEIIQDSSPESPRESFDNFGTMVCWHLRHDLGDKQPKINQFDWMNYIVGMGNEEDTVIVWATIRSRFIILPLYLYDHSGITMSTKPFDCQWDSGQVVWIYCEKGKEGMTDEQLIKYLEGEVETYDQYLRGDVYGFRAYTKTKCSKCGHIEEEDIDSCWGFYGSNPKENGMIDYLPDLEFVKLIEEGEK